jgi:hypothetical protein
MTTKFDKHGWDSAPDETAMPYIELCKLIVANDDVFNSFRRDKSYSTILSSTERIVGEIALESISKLGKLSVLKTNFERLRENDSFGGPQLHSYDGMGDIDSSTLKYFKSAMEIMELVGDFYPKKIVEVGAGYGGLCKVLSLFFEFNEYVIVDLPEVIRLTEKYLSNFPSLHGRVKFVSCENLNSIQSDGGIDLFVADSSLAELNSETQKIYTQKLATNAKFIYVFWNTHHLKHALTDKNTFINSFDSTYKLNIKTVCRSGDLIRMWKDGYYVHSFNKKEKWLDQLKSFSIRIQRSIYIRIRR